MSLPALPEPGSPAIGQREVAVAVFSRLEQEGLPEDDEVMAEVQRRAAALETYDAHWSGVARLVEIEIGVNLRTDVTQGERTDRTSTSLWKFPRGDVDRFRAMARARDVLVPICRKAVETGQRLPRDPLMQLVRERGARERAQAEPPPLADMPRAAVVYVDPPWRYEHAKTANRRIENHYPTMTLEEICALGKDVPAADDSMLLMWATAPKLAEALSVVDAWRFTYRTCMVWVKDQIGMGYYARQRHELLLIAARGRLPVPVPSRRPDSVIVAPRTEHSSKPLLHDLIDEMWPGLPKVELFARQPLDRPWWSTWGNDIKVADHAG